MKKFTFSVLQISTVTAIMKIEKTISGEEQTVKHLSNMMDYLKWRGDLPLSLAPFNEVDALILSMCSYVNYEGIVKEDRTPLFSDAIHAFLLMPDKFRELGVLIPDEIETLADIASSAPRFHGMRVSDFVNEIDEEREMQFSALTYHLPDGTLFVAYRGTDDSLVGWKEDLNLSLYEGIPGETAAKEYLDRIARRHEGDIRVGGHSKGGHHAIYAAVFASRPTQKRILLAYSHDGPGFPLELLVSKRYAAMQEKLITFLPQSSIVGVVLEHDKSYRYIRSTGDGLYQHDPFSWEVSVDKFVYLREPSHYGKRFGGAIRAWLTSTTKEERRLFVETFSKMIAVSGAKTLKELRADGIRAFARASKYFVTMEPKSRSDFRRLFHLLIAQMNYRPKKAKTEKKPTASTLDSAILAITDGEK